MYSLKKTTEKLLGELLIERKVISKKDCDKALDIQRERGGLIGEILVELGLVKEENIAQAVTAQYGFPYLPLANYEIGPEIVKIIPENVCAQYCLIPIDKIGGNLTIAMSNPLNQEAVEDIEELTKCTVQIFVATTTDIRNAIAKYYKNK
ncbi:MAG: hypothetical protein PHS93_06230 [Candidatus Omnitrophica bacterium]|nr:hypothetical protein [Candidatus Omnitrophota bacterium]MDD5352745.1 hypothetical protein [Candidatus Omnitrophota bacterium]MDD5550344.1 hypothetical protein [Candidatus Omnitrophota bacterium]